MSETLDLLRQLSRREKRNVLAYEDLADDRYFVTNATANRTDFASATEHDFNDFDDNFDYDTADAGTVLSCVSTDAADTFAIQLLGLDLNKDPLTEVVVLTGTTPAVSSAVFTRLNSVVVLGGPGAGTVTVDGLGFGWAALAPGATNIHAGRLSVPRHHTFVPEVSTFYSDKTGEYRVKIYQRVSGIPPIEAMPIYLYQTTGELRLFPTATHGPADIYLTIERLTGSGTLFASGIFNGVTYDNRRM